MDKFTTTADRELCWQARDAFFSCLDAARAAPAPTAAPGAPAGADAGGGAACAALRDSYERGCLPSWRRYWDDRYRNGRPIVGRSSPPR
jgi:cytochrome c oxidase assembly factor 6